MELDNTPGGWSLFCLQERGDLWLFLPRGLDSRENTGAARLRKANEKLFPVFVLFFCFFVFSAAALSSRVFESGGVPWFHISREIVK